MARSITYTRLKHRVILKAVDVGARRIRDDIVVGVGGAGREKGDIQAKVHRVTSHQFNQKAESRSKHS